MKQNHCLPVATRQRNRCNTVIFFSIISAPPRRIGAALEDSAAPCGCCTELLVVQRGNECSPDGRLVSDKHPVEESKCEKKQKKSQTKNVRTTYQKKKNLKKNKKKTKLSQQRSFIVGNFPWCISSFPSRPQCSHTSDKALHQTVRRSVGALSGCSVAPLSAMRAPLIRLSLPASLLSSAVRREELRVNLPLALSPSMRASPTPLRSAQLTSSLFTLSPTLSLCHCPAPPVSTAYSSLPFANRKCALTVIGCC